MSSLPIQSPAPTHKSRSGASPDGKNRPPALITCGGCANTWTGTGACHCSGCHRTFTGLSAFDTHRTGGRCNAPETLLTQKGEPRLVPVDRPHWSGWATPGDDTRWAS